LGPRLFWLIKDGRQAFNEEDLESLVSVQLRYIEIRGEEGQPVSIDEYLREEETKEGNWLAREAVADVIEQSLKKSAAQIKLNCETILRYTRMAGRQAYVAQDHRAKRTPPLVSRFELERLLGPEHNGTYVAANGLILHCVSYKML
jgi:DNA topoisomerase IB